MSTGCGGACGGGGGGGGCGSGGCGGGCGNGNGGGCNSNSKCNSKAEQQLFRDVVIIGAGAVGSSIARELAKFELNVVVLEKDADVCQGSSVANSGIVHGGYDAKHGTLKSKLSRRGNRMFPKLNKELDFGYQEVGSLVLSFKDEETEKLKELKENGVKNGVHDLQLLDRKQVLKMEPHVSQGVNHALYCPTAGIVSPYEYVYALVENAAANGVQVLVNQQVTSIDIGGDLKTREKVFKVRTNQNLCITAKYVVNCAGIYADEIAKMVDAGTKYSIQARKGQYVILEKSQGDMARSVIFQTPTERWGKGILVSPTARGNLLIGPSASEQDDKEERNTDTEELAYVVWAARRSVPHLDTRQSLTSFSGLRARSSRKDFIIEQDATVKNFVHVAGIESPGLTSSPAIAVLVKAILQKQCGCEMIPKKSFNPIRKHPVDFSKPKLEKDQLVCVCENVTKTEIERAIYQAGVPVTSTDSIKWRTRAGMGHCQGARCRPEVAEIIASNLQTRKGKVSFMDIPKRVPGTKDRTRVPRDVLARL